MARHPLTVLGRELVFPPVDKAHHTGLLAVGGDLSVERLLLAYGSGIFPWPDKDTPILWWAPPARAVIEPHNLHVGRSLRKIVRRGDFVVRLDHNFPAVIRACAKTPRPGQRGTWILPDMIDAYIRLHAAGYAHSVECYVPAQSGTKATDGSPAELTLVGGLYGVSLGGCFFGESMFSHVDDASKVATVVLCQQLVAWGFDLVDGQVQNDHLERFGFYNIPRAEFMIRMNASLQKPTRRGPWTLDIAIGDSP